jgi:hypothetical protein
MCTDTQQQITREAELSDKAPPQIQIRFEDVPSLAETFADTVGQWHFDGSTLRIDFLVTRVDEAKSPDTRTARKLPVCRLVLPAAGAVDLLNQCRRITAAMEKVGLVSGKNEAAAKPPN